MTPTGVIEVEVEIEADAWIADLPKVETLVRDAAEAAAGARGRGGEGGYVVLLTGDAAIRDLNARFRGKDAATNVLSFPAPRSAAPHRGDVALAYETCAAEARAQGKTLADHLQHLVVHGVLHLLGLDHLDDSEAEAMEAQERSVLAGLGVSDPYVLAETAPDLRSPRP